MSLLRALPKRLLARPLASQFRTSFQPQRFYAQESKSTEEGSGVQKQTDKNARPVILEAAPPAEETEEVRKHNEEFKHRPDRAENRIDPDNKETVGKKFWSGKHL